jgi:hypothetical protein
MGTNAQLEFAMNPNNIQHIQELSSPVAWLFLLTIQTPNNPPLYLVNNNEEFISNGITYLPYPFQLVLPEDTGDKLPMVSLTISNIDGAIIEAIRGFDQAPQITVQLVSSAYPDLVEKKLDYLKLRDVSYDAMTITGNLETINILTRRFPNGSYEPVQFPSLFY